MTEIIIFLTPPTKIKISSSMIICDISTFILTVTIQNQSTFIHSGLFRKLSQQENLKMFTPRRDV